ncbi:type III pantothenate kinase [Idiomarina seosinensis]|uniref:type III pantothenate kinase n=1 Tax=Idiomarina seosinensis TaxID=281739 RepID=UPI00384F2115
MLLIDNGNTRTKFALYIDNQLKFEDKIVNDELEKRLDAYWLQQLQELVGETIQGVGCSVGEKHSRGLIDQRFKHFTGEIKWLTSQRRQNDLVNGYADDFARLGADRWFAMLGYRGVSCQNAVIIDAGTALTIDWLHHSGQHLGGWIVPGRRLMQESLHSGTANLKERLSEQCFPEPATNTQQGMSFGVHYALVGAIAQALEVAPRIFEQQRFNVVVTGGDGERLIQSLNNKQPLLYQRIDDLVFKGLAAAADNLSMV